MTLNIQSKWFISLQSNYSNLIILYELPPVVSFYSFSLSVVGSYVVVSSIYFFKWANSSHFLIYFHLFKHKLQFLQQLNVKKCPSSIQCRDSNSRPLEHESPPITTRPGSLTCLTTYINISLRIPYPHPPHPSPITTFSI